MKIVGKRIEVPNQPWSAYGNNMKATAKSQLQLSETPSPCAQAAIFLDDLETGTLISLSQSCDDDCMALFTKHDVQIAKQNKIIIMGSYEQYSLWSITISQMPVQQANGIIQLDKTTMNWLTITTHLLAAPPKHSFKQYFMEI